MKKLMALIALVAMVAVSSVAFADSADLTVDTSLGASLVFSNDCSNALTITGSGTGGAMINNELGTPATCGFTAYSNNSSGSRVTVSGTDMDNATSDTWTDIANGSTYTLVAGTEAWGYYLPTATGHTTGNDGTNDFVNSTPSYFDVDTVADTVLSTAAPIDNTGAFDLTVNAASSLVTPSGSYSSTVTVDYSDL